MRIRSKHTHKTKQIIRGLLHNKLYAYITALTVAVAGVLLPTVFASAPTVYSTTAWDSNLSKVIHADVTQSVTLPNGKILWIFGDTTSVNGVSTVSGYGYPHDAFVLQKAGTQQFSAVPGTYGYGWQQVPNWSDGTYFWMNTPVVDNGTLYILGERVQGASPFTVVGSYMATFNASTLAYEGIVQTPAGATNTTVWGGVAKSATGWWLTGTHNVSCYIVNCKVGDMAYVPFNSLGDTSKWQVYNNVIPASDNLGTTLALVPTSVGWDIFTKQGDAYGGSNIERLSAATPTGNWTVNGTWPATSPSGTITYGVGVHLEQASPTGQALISYNVNNVSADYHALFLYLPIETAGPASLTTNQAKCMDDYHSLSTNGNKVDIWSCNGTNAQKWTYNYATNHTVTAFGKCLDDAGFGTANGTKVQLWTCTGNSNQAWSEGAHGALINNYAHKCLEDTNATNGTQLQLWTCSGGNNQNWVMP